MYEKPTVPPAGIVIQKECFDRLNADVKEVAKQTCLSRGHLAKILKGKKPITPEIAVKLAQYFREPAGYFMELEMAYQLAQANYTLRRQLAKIEPFPRPDRVRISRDSDQ